MDTGRSSRTDSTGNRVISSSHGALVNGPTRDGNEDEAFDMNEAFFRRHQQLPPRPSSSTRSSSSSSLKQRSMSSMMDNNSTQKHVSFPTNSIPSKPLPMAIEEGEYVWVQDSNTVCIPAIVVRVGIIFDEAKDREFPVMIVHTEDGEEREIRDQKIIKLPSNHQPKLRPPSKIHDLSNISLFSQVEGGKNDIFTTEQLENIVLYTIRARFRIEQIYTWVDRLLVSMNPGYALPIYTPEKMLLYRNGEQLLALEEDEMNETPPHVFALAQNALRTMQETMEDQSIVLLGKNGSGKSEAAKLIVQYLCEMGENKVHSENESDPALLHPIGQQILHAFTILEAFGNASTIQNRNSSRFGKMVSVEYNKHGHVIGGGFTTHFFERSRVIELKRGQRNFHIFYQILAHVQHDPALRDALDLNKSISDFALLKPILTNEEENQNKEDMASSSSSSINSRVVNSSSEDADLLAATASLDARDYRDLMASFSALRLRKNQRLEIVRIIAALLHLGNVEFISEKEKNVMAAVTSSTSGPSPSTSSSGLSVSISGNEGNDSYMSSSVMGLGSSVRDTSGTTTSSSSGGGCVLKDPSQVFLAAKLLEVEPVVLDNYFRTRQFFSKEGNKTVSSLKVVTVAQAKRARDTFIRSVYESLFLFLVETLNSILGGIFDRYEKSNIIINSQGIHVLDLMGFEDLGGQLESKHPYNGFEQLCINYLHEKLHHFFLQCSTHGGSLSMIGGNGLDDVDGGSSCVMLFESDPFGIFPLLNEHSKLRSPCDEDLVSKILAGNESVKCISRPKLPSSTLSPSKDDPKTSSTSGRRKTVNGHSAVNKEWRSLFVIEHYDGQVIYHGKNVSAKNTLSISATCAAIMQSSKNSVLHAVGAAQIAARESSSSVESAKAGQSRVRQSLSSRNQALNKKASTASLTSSRAEANTATSDLMNNANALLSALQHTGKHFMLCIRPSGPGKPTEDSETTSSNITPENPNSTSVPFNSAHVMTQLRQARVVDIMKASHSLLQIPLSVDHFFRRYQNICGHRGTFDSLIRSLSAIGVLEEENYRHYKTKEQILMTSSQWKKLEQARFLYVNACASMIQRNLIKALLRRRAKKVLEKLKKLRAAMNAHSVSSGGVTASTKTPNTMSPSEAKILEALADCQQEFLSLLNPRHQRHLQGVNLLMSPKAQDQEALYDSMMSAVDVSGLEHVRVLEAAKSRLNRMDEEVYVKSVVDDAAANRHHVVMDYAKQIAMKYCPSIDTSHLQTRGKSSSISTEQKPHLLRTAAAIKREQEINCLLRDAILENDSENLMAKLVTLDDELSSMESIERKLATMMIIRSLEEKSATEAFSKTIDSAPLPWSEGDKQPRVQVIRDQWKPSLIKVMALGLESKFPHLAPNLEDLSVLEGDLSSPVKEGVVTESSTEATTTTEKEASVAEVPSGNTEGLLLALERAFEEENFIAMDRILIRLNNLNTTKNLLMKQVERKLDQGLHTLSSHVERKQVVKFLNIAADLSGDLDLLDIAIKEATTAGLAKWDFNLKNAQKEREKLFANAGSSTTSTANPVAREKASSVVRESNVKVVTNTISAALVEAYVWKIWSSSTFEEISTLKRRLQRLSGIEWCLELVNAKLARAEKIKQIHEHVQNVLAPPSSVRPRTLRSIEEVLEKSIQNGYWSKHFQQLFGFLDELQGKYDTQKEEKALEATLNFLEKRLRDQAEIREDAHTLLTHQIQGFTKQQVQHGNTTNTAVNNVARNNSGLSGPVHTGSSDGNSGNSREDLLNRASLLKRTLEKIMASRRKMESLLALPLETLNSKSLESNLEIARSAGVSGKLITKAEERLLAAKAKEQRNLSNTSESTRNSSPLLSPSPSMVSSATSGNGPLMAPTFLSLDNSAAAFGGSGNPEVDAVAFYQFEKLRDRQKEALLCWEGRVLTKSLCVFDENSLLEDMESNASKNQLAIAINKCILGYMRDRIVFYREMLAQSLLQIGFCEPALVDEIYLQLMKQLTKNPKRDSSLRGWCLFVLCACSFAPSIWLEKYVIVFLQSQVSQVNSFWRLVKNFAEFALKKLENIMMHGATGFLPSLEEIRAYEARPPFLTNIELIDGTPLAEAFPISPEMTVSQMIEICCHFLDLPDEIVQYLGLVVIVQKNHSVRSQSITFSNVDVTPTTIHEDLEEKNTTTNITASTPTASSSSSNSSYFHKFLNATSFLRSSEYLGDIFERELVRGRDVRFVLKIRLVPVATVAAAAVAVSGRGGGGGGFGGSGIYSPVFFQDEICLRLMYLQVLEEIIQGFLPLEEIETVLYLAAIGIAIDFGGMTREEGADDVKIAGIDLEKELPIDAENSPTAMSLGLPKTVDQLLETNILEYIPTEWHKHYETEEIWAEAILRYIEAIEGKALNELQSLFVEETMRHRLYSASFFPSKLLLPRSKSKKKDLVALANSLGLLELSSYFVVAVNGLGIHFVGRDGTILGSFGYNQVIAFGGTYHNYTLILKGNESLAGSNSGGAGGSSSTTGGSHTSFSNGRGSGGVTGEEEEICITTKYADELTALLKDYKRLYTLAQDV